MQKTVRLTGAGGRGVRLLVFGAAGGADLTNAAWCQVAANRRARSVRSVNTSDDDPSGDPGVQGVGGALRGPMTGVP